KPFIESLRNQSIGYPNSRWEVVIYFHFLFLTDEFMLYPLGHRLGVVEDDIRDGGGEDAVIVLSALVIEPRLPTRRLVDLKCGNFIAEEEGGIELVPVILHRVLVHSQHEGAGPVVGVPSL